jgi:hypothetical protein
VFAHNSGLQPKEPQVRVIGWAVCGLSGGRWRSVQGWLEAGASVATGEAVAAARAVEVVTPGGRAITDCSAVKRMWDRIRRKPDV